MSPLLIAYDREQADALLRGETAQGLRDALRGGRFGLWLSAAERAALDDLLTAWVQRALGAIWLCDAMLVDAQRAAPVYRLICAALTYERAPVPAELAPQLRGLAAGQPLDVAAADADPQLAALVERAQRSQLALALLDGPTGYPLPADLAALRPPPPRYPHPGDSFEQPSGWRGSLAAAMAAAGVGMLAGPLLLGALPQHPAGMPLALLTLALLIGIRAGWAGFGGSLCIWLVANLPGFRHDSGIAPWPALPLLSVGVALLACDGRVRLMWAWIRRQIARR
jgi:hypothetical protein